MADATPAQIAGAQNLLVIASTWGEGDPPQRAIDFYRGADGGRCAALRGPALCGAGAGRSRLCEVLRDRAACSTNASPRWARRASPSGSSATWITRRRPGLDRCDAWRSCSAELGEPEAGPRSSMSISRAPAAGTSRLEPDAAVRGGDHRARPPVAAAVPSSDTWHVELSLQGSGIEYEPGDSLGFVPRNDPALVDAVLAATGPGGRCGVARDAARAVRHHHADARRSCDAHAGDGSLAARLGDGRQVIDLLEAAPQQADRGAADCRCCGRCRRATTRSPPAARRCRTRRICWSPRVRYETHGRAAQRRCLGRCRGAAQGRRSAEGVPASRTRISGCRPIRRGRSS